MAWQPGERSSRFSAEKARTCSYIGFGKRPEECGLNFLSWDSAAHRSCLINYGKEESGLAQLRDLEPVSESNFLIFKVGIIISSPFSCWED